MSSTKSSLPPVTFVIPTYGGVQLVRRNLPSILAEAITGDEVIISEDKVDDFALRDYLRDQYHLTGEEFSAGKWPPDWAEVWRGQLSDHGQSIAMTFIQRRYNGRFARNVNQAVQLVKTDFFLLLNDDVQLERGGRRQLWQTIDQDDQIWAVGAREIDDAADGQESGLNQIWWGDGRYWHRADPDLAEPAPTAWTCGGSSLYRTKVWREIGGFDTRYYPAYWEDIDVAWVARQRGYESVYCPTAVVHHVHETTNATVFGQEKIKRISWDNGTKFAWKNSTWDQKVEFCRYYFYWQLKQFPAVKWWWVVIIVALITRLGLLNAPRGLTVDEAAIAYNGYGIWTQHRDEWLTFLPVSFRSYGDYKAPLAIYVTGLLVKLFGPQIWAIRLPFAVVGVVSVFLVMKIVDLLLADKKPNHYVYAALAGWLLVVSPWHFHFSHLGFENNWALMFTLLGGYWWLKYFTSQTDNRGLAWERRWWASPLVGVGVAWVLAMYAYHAAKITVPILLLVGLVWSGRKIIARWRSVLVAGAISLVLLAPLIKDSWWGEGLTRANSSFVMDQELSTEQKWQLFGKNLLAHFMPSYLIGGQLNQAQDWQGETILNVRHGDGWDGVLTWAQVFLLVVALLSFVRFGEFRRTYGRELGLGVLLVIIGTCPAALTTQVPHSNQAFLAVVGYGLLSVGGLIGWRYWWRSRHIVYYPGAVMLWLVVTNLIFVQFLGRYIDLFSDRSLLSGMSRVAIHRSSVDHLFARDFLVALTAARQYRSEVDQVVIATGFEHQYIYILLNDQVTPEDYRSVGYLNHYFLINEAQFAPSELGKSHVLVVFTPATVPDQELYQSRCQQLKTIPDQTDRPRLILCWTKNDET